jgi:geranyl-CoA carboxylase alpha subunit
MSRSISTLLVANRGEIAVRIMRTARRLGIKTIAVFADADADAPHVDAADEAIHIGPSPVGESYLRADAIIAAAQASGADAVHPGYGFLSENADFARRCEAEGLIFVGPPPEAIDIMGDKARSKRAMIAAGVPCVPGYQDSDQSEQRLIAAAEETGFPIMVKAAAGGGGRGMRLVTEPDALPAALKLARSEAENAFGSGDLILEKAIIRPRHVEIQIFADSHGTTLHFGERDCSVQRRHQKVIEESPCPVMTDALRAQMGEAAVRAAESVDYVGAGTVEFLLDEEGRFYFLEMNTRLQVEHPVTEMITGHDLVALQLAVAAGEPLGLTEDDVKISGHAIEARLYAEDTDNDFLPSTGPIDLWRAPEGQGIRVDAGVKTGGEVSPYYDPMLAKIIAHGATREDARRRLVNALQQTALLGPRTNRDFLIAALSAEHFIAGQATTAFIAENFDIASRTETPAAPADFAIAAVIRHRLAQSASMRLATNVNPELLDWSSTGAAHSIARLVYGEQVETVAVLAEDDQSYCVQIGTVEIAVALTHLGKSSAQIAVDGKKQRIAFIRSAAGALTLATATHTLTFADTTRGDPAAEESGGTGRIIAPMHGVMIEVLTAVGQKVAKGDVLAILEAMKMQHQIIADVDGSVATIAVASGDQVAADDLILEIDEGEKHDDAAG